MKRAFGIAAIIAISLPAFAQQGIARVQAAEAPFLAPQLPAVSTPTGRGPMPTPMPQGVIAAPVDLKEEAIDRIAPLSAKEVRQLREELDTRQSAMQEPLAPVGKPVRRVVTLDLSPGAPPEMIRVAWGQGGVVTFMDAAGRPWPVVQLDNFNPKGLDVAALGVNGVSIGVKTPSSRMGNLAVQLKGLTSPVTFAVAVGQAEIDYSVEMQLARYLPGEPAPVGAVDGLPALAGPELLNYLLGTPPQAARKLAADTPTVQVWQTGPQTMVIRTEALLASPRYSRRQSSSNGMTVYELPLSPRLVLASQGQMQAVAVTGFEGTKEPK